MPNNVLELCFNKIISPKFVEELKKISPVPFKFLFKEPDASKVLTAPGYLHVDQVLVLTFESGDAKVDFKRVPECRDLFDKYNS